MIYIVIFNLIKFNMNNEINDNIVLVNIWNRNDVLIVEFLFIYGWEMGELIGMVVSCS